MPLKDKRLDECSVQELNSKIKQSRRYFTINFYSAVILFFALVITLLFTALVYLVLLLFLCAIWCVIESTYYKMLQLFYETGILLYIIRYGDRVEHEIPEDVQRLSG